MAIEKVIKIKRLYPKLSVDELRFTVRLGNEYEAEVSQKKKLLYNILILRIFHYDQKGDWIDKLRHDLYTEEWKAARNQGCK